MNDIKFRAWDKEDSKIRKVLGMSFEHGAISVELNNEKYLQDDASRFEIMQYTGLKDKNGTEIYEGDILSTDLDRPYLIVEFRNGAFMFQCHDNGKDYYDFMATTGENSNFTKYHEVIGSIYENSELLGCDGE